jgi:hypothetical protein
MLTDAIPVEAVTASLDGFSAMLALAESVADVVGKGLSRRSLMISRRRTDLPVPKEHVQCKRTCHDSGERIRAAGSASAKSSSPAEPVKKTLSPV